MRSLGMLKTSHTHTHLLGIVDPLKVNEGEAARASSPLVVHHVDPRQRAVAREHLPQVALRGVQAQAEHPEARVGVRVRLLRSQMGKSAPSSFSPSTIELDFTKKKKIWLHRH